MFLGTGAPATRRLLAICSSDLPTEDDGYFSELEAQGTGLLLRKYVMLLCNHASDVLQVAVSLSNTSSKHFSLVSKVIRKDVTGTIQPQPYVLISYTVTSLFFCG